MDEKNVFCKIKSGEGQEWGRAGVGKGEWGRASWAGAGAVGEEEWLNFRDCLHQICVSHSHSAFALPHSCPSPLLEKGNIVNNCQKL